MYPLKRSDADPVCAPVSAGRFPLLHPLAYRLSIRPRRRPSPELFYTGSAPQHPERYRNVKRGGKAEADGLGINSDEKRQCLRFGVRSERRRDDIWEHQG